MHSIHRVITAGLTALILMSAIPAADPGIPFTEDFTTQDLCDTTLTTANWSASEEALILNWRQTRFGGFATGGITASNITGDAHNSYAIALGDLDGDGDLDLAVGNRDQRNRVYINDGEGDPWDTSGGFDVGSETDNTLSVALGDLDGDGDLDLVVANYSDQLNRVYLNSGDGTAWSAHSITGDAVDSCSVAVDDIDGDHDLDVVVGNMDDGGSGRYNRLYVNSGTGTGWTGSNITTDAHNTWSVSLGDVDGDGHLDVIAGNSAQVNRLYLNNGSGTAWTGSDISADTETTSATCLGDADGDGDIDLIAGSHSNGEYDRLYLNNGTAFPFAGVSGTNIPGSQNNTYAVAQADADGDGDLDLFTGAVNGAWLYVNNGTANPFLGSSGISIVPADTHDTFGLALGDPDQDGDLDLVTASGHTSPSENRLYLSNSTVAPLSGVAGTGISSDVLWTNSVALGDLDDDGDLDLVTGNSGDSLSPSEVNRVYLNNGSSAPFAGVAGINITSDSDGTYAVAVGHVNNDGHLDIVAGNRTSASVNRLYLGDGTGTAWTGSDITADADVTCAVALADVDDENGLDLVVGNDGVNRLYLNNGTADPFGGVTGSIITTDSHYTWSLAVGDVDGDGHLDLIAGNRDDPNRLYLGDGSGDPWDTVSGIDIPGGALNTYAVALGDLDDDGDLDLVTGEYIAPSRVYLNDGSGDPWDTVVAPIALTGDSTQTTSVALGDVNRDGDLDIIEGNIDAQACRVYLNDGTGTGWNASDILGTTPDTLAMALGDLDGDGDLDLVRGNGHDLPSSQNLLHLNNLYLPGALHHTALGRGTSLSVVHPSTNVEFARLVPTQTLPPNTGIDYWMSNDGGARWHIVQASEEFTFPTPGTDLRWRAELWSLSPVLTPRLETMEIPGPVPVELSVFGSN